MPLNELLKSLAEDVNPSDKFRKDMEDFVDNYIGTEEQGYQNINIYKKENPNKFKPLFRELKKQARYAYFQSLLRPFFNKGTDNLLSIVE